MKRALILLALAPALAGCDPQTLKGSVAGSCAVFERPPYAVKGKTQYDQGVADNFVESGVAGCNWRRPAARPASIEVPSSRGAVAAPAAKKRGLLKRIKDRAAHPFSVGAAPVVASPAIAAEPALPPMVEAPNPRDPVDELLHPEGGK